MPKSGKYGYIVQLNLPVGGKKEIAYISKKFRTAGGKPGIYETTNLKQAAKFPTYFHAYREAQKYYHKDYIQVVEMHGRI